MNNLQIIIAPTITSQIPIFAIFVNPNNYLKVLVFKHCPMKLRNGKRKKDSVPRNGIDKAIRENSFHHSPYRGQILFDTDNSEDSDQNSLEFDPVMNNNRPGSWPTYPRGEFPPQETPNSMMSFRSQSNNPHLWDGREPTYTTDYIRSVVGLPPLPEDDGAAALNPEAPPFSASVPNTGTSSAPQATISVHTTNTNNTATSSVPTTFLSGGAPSVPPLISQPIRNDYSFPSSTYTTAGFRRLSAFPPVPQESSTDRLLVALMNKLDMGLSNLSSSIQTMNQVSRVGNPPNPPNASNDAIARLENIVSNLASQVQSLGERMNSAPGSTIPNTTPVENQPSQGARSQFYENSAPVYRTWPDKWKVKYDGDNSKLPIEFFLDQLCILKESNDVTWENVICSFPQFLEGEPSKWFFRYRRANRHFSWETLKRDMIIQFRGIESDESLICKLTSKKQTDFETFDQYYSCLQDLQDRITTKVFTPTELIGILQYNVRRDIQTCLVSFQPQSLDEFIKIVRKTDKLLHPHLYGEKAPHHRRVSELEGDVNPDIPVTVEAFTARKHPHPHSSQNMKCWNCDTVGHSWQLCEEPRTLFCYWCGFKNATCRNCPSCKTSNFRSVTRTPDPPDPASSMNH